MVRDAIATVADATGARSNGGMWSSPLGAAQRFRFYRGHKSLRGPTTTSAGGAVKNRGQPHEPRCRDTTCKSKASTTVRGTDARWYSVPTPSHTRPQAVSFARRV